jgi:hypothetical protein
MLRRILLATLFCGLAHQAFAANGTVCDSSSPANCASVKAASTAAVAGDPSAVTQISPNQPQLTTPLNVQAIQAFNVTPTDCSSTITTGGTAQNAITAQTTLHGFTIGNIDSTAGSGEPLWISFTGTAAASTAGSWPLAAPTATTFAGFTSYSTPPGFGTNHAVSIIGATTGHKFSCTWW